ncbi:MAG TPA: AraC family transcriptional regulator [Planctomycetaceae bacterium]|nr:AraC family transcriptional regulator [Planctomycetaceae bacterium]
MNADNVGGINNPQESTASKAQADDVLSAFLAPCRLECRRIQTWRFASPWGLEFRKAGPAFVIVLEGGCVLRVAGMPDDLTIRAGDLVVFTRENQFVLCDRVGSRLTDGDRMIEASAGTPSELHLGGAGPASRLLWGGFGTADDYTRHAFSLLPPVLLARGEGPGSSSGLEPIVRVLLEEIDERRPGAELLLNQVLHALLVYGLRATPLTLPESQALVPALGVPGLGMAVAAIHARPEHDWSVRALAETAGLSRSKFAIQFVEVLGCPPFEYLRDVRMRLACRLLLETDCGIKEITAKVGYATEASFSKAFARCCGCAPGFYRQQKSTQRVSQNSHPS